MSAGTGIAPLARGGKYVTFRLEDLEFGLEILNVQEINGALNVKPASGLPGFVRGVAVRDGQPIPVINLRQQFGFSPVADSERTSLILVDAATDDRRVPLGLVVDEVAEITRIRGEEIGPPAEAEDDPVAPFVNGLGHLADRAIHLLDVDRLYEMAGLGGLDN